MCIISVTHSPFLNASVRAGRVAQMSRQLNALSATGCRENDMTSLLPTPIIIEFKFLTRKEDSSFNLENAGKGNARFKIILVSHLITPQLRLLMNQFGFQGWSTSLS